jgi:translation initiation factor IF-2
VDGSVEALSRFIVETYLPMKSQVKVVHKGVGQISESDVNLGYGFGCYFDRVQRAPFCQNAKNIAENENIEIKLYSIIYNAIAGCEKCNGRIC